MEDISEKIRLQDYKIEGLIPGDFYYIRDFISPQEEASILQKIPPNRWTHLTHRRLQAHPSTLTQNNTLLASPLPPYLTHPIIPRFTQLGIFAQTPHKAPNHVLINEYLPGQGIMPHEDGDAYAGVVATVSLGGSLCLEVVSKSGDGERQGAGEDEERGGQEQGDQQQEEDATTTPPHTISLPTRIYQEPRSLLLTAGPAYRSTLHGISPISVDEDLSAATVANWSLLGAETRERVERDGGTSVRGTRVSLTYRDVLRVSGAVGKVFGVRR